MRAGRAVVALLAVAGVVGCTPSGGSSPAPRPGEPVTEQSVLDAIVPQGTDLRRAGLVEGDELPARRSSGR